ncbi:RICIN domain-containing protein [Streptomyces sp. NPDC048442]|uniref:RICIN domain-containing protein n=1 Tax=Streptomyces sp. NPDC048442 TaxID=3154823 RepID=UPI003416600B
MAVTPVRLGELDIAFTSTFTLRYNDSGTGAKLAGSFYHPVPPEGFRALGSIGRPDYTDPQGSVAAVCVRAANTGSTPPLADAVDYKWVWDDSGTGGKMDGTCWRPVPPPGYKALGNVFTNSYSKPSPSDVTCVREDLVAVGAASALVWNDSAGGGKHDFSAWQISAPTSYIDETADASKAMIAPETFVGYAGYAQPQFREEMNILCLPLPSSKQSVTLTKPVLTSRDRPAQTTSPVTDHRVTVPFTAVQDSAKSLAWKIEKSPFYTIERQVWWTLLLFNDNATSTDQTLEDAVTVGVEKTRSETFQSSTGLSVTAETGVSFFGVGAKVSATVSVTLGYESSTAISQFQSRTVTRRLVTPKGTAGALWVGSYAFRAVRADGTVVAAPLKFDGESFHHAQFPAAAGTDTPVSTVPARAWIIAKHSGKAVGVAGNSQDNGAQLIQWDRYRGDNEKFTLEPAGDGSHYIVPKHSGKAIGIADNSQDNGAQLIQWDRYRGDNEKFTLEPAGDGSHYIVPKHSGKTLDVPGASVENGTQLVQWNRSTGDNQKFRLETITDQEW